MDVLCLMGLFPDEYRAEIQKDSKRGMQNAADKLQWAIVKGLDQIEGVRTSIVNSLYIGSYPKKYSRLMIPTFEFKHSENANDLNVGFCNLTGFKWISRYSGARKAVEKWARTTDGTQKVLLIYALTTPFANIANYIKKKHPEIKICIVVPDLPEYMNTAAHNKKSFYWKLKSLEIKMIRKSIKKVDAYVLLTDAMKDWFGYPVNYTVVEGIAVDAEENMSVRGNAVKKKVLLYAGGIKAEYGVIDLIRAFIEIGNEEWELSIYGDGSDIEMAKKLACDHPNVKFHGMVPNSIVVEAQKEASVLVNPRKNQPFTKYSFPSKILEYMSSGTTVLAYKLDGIPAEYDPYYLHIEDSDDGMKNALERVMNLTEDELDIMGESAMKFVAENKNPKCQCQKIVDMINKI